MKKTLLAVLVFTLSLEAFCQTAKSAVTEAAKKDSLDQSLSYLKKTVPALEPAAEKRAGYAFLGSLQEQMGDFQSALDSYAKAASIGAGDAAGMPKKSSEQLVIDAVRCALSAGDWPAARNYLNSAVRNSPDEKIIAYVKLYEQWSLLCKAQKIEETVETVAMLKAYTSLDSMKTVHPQLYLTLWHITGDSLYSDTLKKSFPKSPEAAIVKGEIQTLPAPFWYFVPRNSTSTPEVGTASTKVSAKATETAASNAGKEEKTSAENKSEKIVRQQLGLFKDKANAQGLVTKLKDKGFAARIVEETRASGTTYYIVVVDENKDGTVAKELRTAGFECYPVFE